MDQYEIINLSNDCARLMVARRKEAIPMAVIRNLFSSEDSGRLFEPDAVLGAQFYATYKSSPYKQPELRLMAAVLEDAISCLSMKLGPATARQRKQLEDARQWFAAEDDSEWIFSFKNICETLGIDPAYLRRGLIRWAAATELGSARDLTTVRTASSAPPAKIRLRAGS
jgi:hypothetical protein